jgi:hypothetical protein
MGVHHSTYYRWEAKVERSRTNVADARSTSLRSSVAQKARVDDVHKELTAHLANRCQEGSALRGAGGIRWRFSTDEKVGIATLADRQSCLPPERVGTERVRTLRRRSKDIPIQRHRRKQVRSTYVVPLPGLVLVLAIRAVRAKLSCRSLGRQ